MKCFKASEMWGPDRAEENGHEKFKFDNKITWHMTADGKGRGKIRN